MQQLEIQYFWPLTEQSSLDLDYAPCKKYEEEKRARTTISPIGSLLIGNGGTWSTTNVAPTFNVSPSYDSVGYWKVTPDFHVHVKHKPKWLAIKAIKYVFGWEWKDK